MIQREREKHSLALFVFSVLILVSFQSVYLCPEPGCPYLVESKQGPSRQNLEAARSSHILFHKSSPLSPETPFTQVTHCCPRGDVDTVHGFL